MLGISHTILLITDSILPKYISCDPVPNSPKTYGRQVIDMFEFTGSAHAADRSYTKPSLICMWSLIDFEWNLVGNVKIGSGLIVFPNYVQFKRTLTKQIWTGSENGFWH